MERSNYTSKYRPWEIKLSILLKDRTTAMYWEKYIKSQKSKKFIEALVLERSKINRDAQLVRVPTRRD